MEITGKPATLHCIGVFSNISFLTKGNISIPRLKSQKGQKPAHVRRAKTAVTFIVNTYTPTNDRIAII